MKKNMKIIRGEIKKAINEKKTLKQLQMDITENVCRNSGHDFVQYIGCVACSKCGIALLTSQT